MLQELKNHESFVSLRPSLGFQKVCHHERRKTSRKEKLKNYEIVFLRAKRHQLPSKTVGVVTKILCFPAAFILAVRLAVVSVQIYLFSEK